MTVKHNMKMPDRMIIIRFLVVIGVMSTANPLHAQWLEKSWSQMGTRISIKLWADSKTQAQQAEQIVRNEMRRIDFLMSPFIQTSELAKLNRLAPTQSVSVSTELFSLIQQAIDISRQTNGVFDITFASVGYKYQFRKHQRPTQNEINNLLHAVDYKHIKLNLAQKSVIFSHPKVKIDLGGIAKGYAVQNAIKLLNNHGVRHAVVTAGGDSMMLGDKRGKPWIVGIQDPRNSAQNAVVLPLANTAMSTSGDYERYFIEGDTRYHHILSPATGKPARNNRSVTIIGENATITDALSTTLFILTYDKALKLLKKFPGYDAIIIDKTGKLHYSSGLKRSN